MLSDSFHYYNNKYLVQCIELACDTRTALAKEPANLIDLGVEQLSVAVQSGLLA